MTALDDFNRNVAAMGLTNEDVAQIKTLVTQPAWAAIQKVWSWQSRQFLKDCANVREDHRFRQGMYAGHGALLQIVDQLTHPPAAEVSGQYTAGRLEQPWNQGVPERDSFVKKYQRPAGSSGSANDFTEY